MSCQPCEQRRQRLNSLIPGLGDLVAEIITIVMTSDWFLSLHIWLFGETPGERERRMNFYRTSETQKEERE